MEAGHLRENPQTPQQQETLQAITSGLQKADGPSFSSKQSSHQTQRNCNKLTSSGFKQQPVCTPLPQQETKSSTKLLALTDPILALEDLLKTGFAQKGLPSSHGSPTLISGFFFFSSSMADVALWLGPYMSISSKTSLYKDPKGPAMQANHNKPKTTQKKPDDPQIPQPDLRFATRKSKPDTQKGPEPKRKQPQKRFASGRSGQTPASLTKTCKK